eukprot:366063-Chlamydomonas_euryale.AAC.5
MQTSHWTDVEIGMPWKRARLTSRGYTVPHLVLRYTRDRIDSHSRTICHSSPCVPIHDRHPMPSHIIMRRPACHRFACSAAALHSHHVDHVFDPKRRTPAPGSGLGGGRAAAGSRLGGQDSVWGESVEVGIRWWQGSGGLKAGWQG